MQVWSVLHAARWKYRMQKIAIWAPLYNFVVHLCRALSSQLRHVSTIEKKLVKQQYLLQMFPQYGDGLLAAEICPVVWGTPANFNGFYDLAALLHSSQVVSISQTLWRWTEGTTYVRQGDHHVGHCFAIWSVYFLRHLLRCLIRLLCLICNHHSW